MTKQSICFSAGYRTAITVFLALLLSCPPVHAKKQSDQPPGPTPPPLNACQMHLLRPADQVITMQPNKSFYKSTINAQNVLPTTLYSMYDLPISGFGGCTRWVIDVEVPENTSSGCSNCYDWAEIMIGADSFVPDSTQFEEYFYRPKSSVSKAFCESYKHYVSVYKKPAGYSAFMTTPLKNYYYRGHYENGMCRVYHDLGGGIVHDTSEIFGSIIPPSSGMDTYRIVHSLQIDGSYRNSVLVVEFEENQRYSNARELKTKDISPFIVR